MSILVTGFGPFGSVLDNPSAELARQSGHPYRVLQVSYHAADEFLADLQLAPEDVLLHLGVSAKSRKLRKERFARNIVGRKPDVQGFVPSEPVIETEGPKLLRSSLWWQDRFLPGEPKLTVSTHAGDYLCNYLYYRSLRRFPANRIGFLHVTTFKTVPLEIQAHILHGILKEIA